VTRTGECGGNSKELWQELLVSMNQSIDYPSKCKFGFHSVLANTLEPPRHDPRSPLYQSFESSALLLRRRNSQTVLTRVHRARSIDCSLFIVHILMLVQLIVPLINYWQQTLCRGLILFTLSRYHEDGALLLSSVQAKASRQTCKLRDCKP
jgi:hypothetical protein